MAGNTDEHEVQPRLSTLVGDDATLTRLLASVGCEIALVDSRGRLRWHTAQWPEHIRALGLSPSTIGEDFQSVSAADDPESTAAAAELGQLVDRVTQGSQTHAEAELMTHAAAVSQAPSRQRGPIGRPDAAGSGGGSRPAFSARPTNVIDLRSGRPLMEAVRATCVHAVVTRISERLIALVLRDLSSQRSHERTLQYLAFNDTLTGLPNRNAVEQKINEALMRARRSHTSVGLLYCDLDNFKEVNDTYGHLAGDDLLRRIAGRWSTWVRDTDVLARMSGDEFLLLADVVAGPAELAGLAHRLAAGLMPSFRIAGRGVRITMCTGGVFAGPEDARNANCESLLAAADAALYEAKRRGDDQLVMRLSANATGPRPEPPDAA